MEIKEIVGIDFSKATFDAYIRCKAVHCQFENNPKGFKKFKQWLVMNPGKDSSGVMSLIEFTGLYSYLFEEFMHEQKLVLAKVPGLEIKKSLGIARGKSDQVDAKRIAEYGWEKRDKLTPALPPDQTTLRLKNLLSLRDKLVRDRAGYKARRKELKKCLRMADSDELLKMQQAIIDDFTKQIAKAEKEIKDLLHENEKIKKAFDLLVSIKGIGLVVASYVIAYTDNFSKFDDARQFACYVGIAPFPYKSGTSIKGKTKVSYFANKKIKSLLYLAASSAIQYNAELKAYYERRLNAGKSEMSSINIIKNKLVHRMFAVIKRGSPYTIGLPVQKIAA